MENKTLAGVEDTLFIPLAARVYISQKFPEYFYDAKSLESAQLEAVQNILGKSSEYSAMASVSRYRSMDQFARDFIKRYPDGQIISCGAGLETMNFRLQDLPARFYAIDFPQVIHARQKILGKTPNETMIPGDMCNMVWTEELDTQKPSLLIISGVFQYFHERQVIQFIQDIQKRFKNVECVFDATNEVGIRYAQRYVKKTGNMNAMMYFYINDPMAFAEKTHTRLLEVRGFFGDTHIIPRRKLKLFTRIAMKVADDKKRTLLIHLKIN